VAVDGLGDVGGLMAYGVADLLDRDAVAAHDRDSRVTALLGVPVAEACSPGHLGEPPVELAGRVGGTVLVAEDEVVFLPRCGGFAALSRLALAVGVEGDHSTFGEFERALRLGSLGVAALARRAPDVAYSPAEVDVVPRELAQLTGSSASWYGQVGTRESAARALLSLRRLVGWPENCGVPWRGIGRRRGWPTDHRGLGRPP